MIINGVKKIPRIKRIGKLKNSLLLKVEDGERQNSLKNRSKWIGELKNNLLHKSEVDGAKQISLLN